jgi:hypothetical protein
MFVYLFIYSEDWTGKNESKKERFPTGLAIDDGGGCETSSEIGE